MARQQRQVVIAGAGPAGMVMAYQLASNGVPVRVLERHPDFRREFRGELLQRTTLEALERAGILDLLQKRRLTLIPMERRMFIGHSRQFQPPGASEVGGVVSQPGLLELLHEMCSAFPNYRLDLGTTVHETIQRGGRVAALKVRRAGAEEEIQGDLFIACNGRNSALRKSCGLETEVFEQTADALWLRFDFSDAPSAMPTCVDVHMFGKGLVVVLSPSSQQRLHIAFSAPGDLSGLKKDLPELRRRLIPTLQGEVRRLVEAKLDAATETQVLKIIVDRVKRWYAPGILFLGDAAHTMSPSGGQGLNVALRDTFVAANHLIPLLQAGAVPDEEVFALIQQDREPEIAGLQAAQTRAGQMVLKPLPILHLMCSMLALFKPVIAKKMASLPSAPIPEPRYLTAMGRRGYSQGKSSSRIGEAVRESSSRAP